MADSNITKRALGESLKKLMLKMPYLKISISDICEQCQMNRKSFYYHFKDKEDLLNWIFDNEFLSTAKEREYESLWMFIGDICAYFYEDRVFYRKAFMVEGQNSFSDHFREVISPAVRKELYGVLSSMDESADFYVDFFSDSIICAIKRWMSVPEPPSSDEFTRRIKSCINIAKEC